LWYSLAAILLVYGGPQRFAAVSAATLAATVGVGVFKLLKKIESSAAAFANWKPHCWSKVLPPDRFSFSIRSHHDGVFYRRW